MEVESGLAPVKIRLNSNIRQYAFRMLKLSSKHPINREINRFQALQDNELLGAKFTKPIQIERIYSSIMGLVNTSSLEPLEHFKFSPWNQQVPYSVKIDKAPKDKAASNHNQHLLTITSNSTKSIYTDASSIPNQVGIGVGFAIFENTPLRPIHSESWNLGDQ